MGRAILLQVHATLLDRSTKNVCDARTRFRGSGLDGVGGEEFLPTEFGKMCIPLKKSWLRPCGVQFTFPLLLLGGLHTAANGDASVHPEVSFISFFSYLLQ